jgi:transcriptional regulator with GAF, ATPase, and Fis domain
LGVSDVLDWIYEEGRLAEQTAARIRRRTEIERLVNDESVRKVLVGKSPVWRALVHKLVEIAVFFEGNVLIVGETGTGKELMAEIIHTLDQQAPKPKLIVVDRTTLSPELSGSELSVTSVAPLRARSQLAMVPLRLPRGWSGSSVACRLKN